MRIQKKKSHSLDANVESNPTPGLGARPVHPQAQTPRFTPALGTCSVQRRGREGPVREWRRSACNLIKNRPMAINLAAGNGLTALNMNSSLHRILTNDPFSLLRRTNKRLRPLHSTSSAALSLPGRQEGGERSALTH